MSVISKTTSIPSPFICGAPPSPNDERSRSIRLLTSYCIYKQARLNATYMNAKMIELLHIKNRELSDYF